MNKIFLIILVISIGSCTTRQNEVEEERIIKNTAYIHPALEGLPNFDEAFDDQNQTIDEIAQEFIGHGYTEDFYLFKTIDEMKIKYGDPILFETQDIPNRFEIGLTDAIYEIKYELVEFVIYHYKGENQKFIFLKVIALKADFPVNYGLNVGCEAADVLEKLGRPSAAQGENFLYINFDGYNDVTFYVENGKVIEIEWNQSTT